MSEAYTLVDDSPWRHKQSAHEYKRVPVLHFINFFVFRSRFVCSASHDNRRRTMDNQSSKCFRKCVPLCPRFMTPADTHDLYFGVDHMRLALEGCIYSEEPPLKLCPFLERWGTSTLRHSRDLNPKDRRSSWPGNLRFRFLNPRLPNWAICWIRKPIVWYLLI